MEQEPEPTSGGCPYRGLAAFGPGDARWFFGRERVTADLVSQLGERLGGGAPLALVAPAGAGKSALLQAGLVPALARRVLPGSDHWHVVLTTPTEYPLAALTTGLATATGRDPVETTTAVGDPQFGEEVFATPWPKLPPRLPDSLGGHPTAGAGRSVHRPVQELDACGRIAQMQPCECKVGTDDASLDRVSRPVQAGNGAIESIMCSVGISDVREHKDLRTR